MNNDWQSDEIGARPDSDGDDPDDSGWDPYILSIFSKNRKPYTEERRRQPRTREANRRRALLIARSRRER